MPVQIALKHTRNRLAWAVATLIGWIVMVISPLSLAAEAGRSAHTERPAEASVEVIHQSIEQLDSDLFIEREEATRRLVDVPVEFVGFTIGDEFVVGYGMDWEGRFRNVASIWAVMDLSALTADPDSFGRRALG